MKPYTRRKWCLADVFLIYAKNCISDNLLSRLINRSVNTIQKKRSKTRHLMGKLI
jgi:hypothetical protein